MNIKHWFMHTWNKWRFKGNLVRLGTKSVVAHLYERECTVCGKVEIDHHWFAE